MKDLLRIADLTPEQLTYLVDLAAVAQTNEHAGEGLLEHQTAVLYFAKPSPARGCRSRRPSRSSAGSPPSSVRASSSSGEARPSRTRPA